jgi:hypothetical protein
MEKLLQEDECRRLGRPIDTRHYHFGLNEWWERRATDNSI